MSGRGETHGDARGSSSSSSPPVPPRFNFQTGELVLIKWSDGMVYFAKIKKIDHRHAKCTVVFDDKSQDEASFDQIHSVDETTTDIICIKCKKDDSDSPNEIVLCDTCGIGFHQKCHIPPIPAYALKLDTPWNCIYCQKGSKCPYLTESLDVLQNLLSDEEQGQVGSCEDLVTVESDQEEYEGATKVTVNVGLTKKRKKSGRPPGSKRGLKTNFMSPKEWKQKLASAGSIRGSESPPRAMHIPNSPLSSSSVEITVGKKRKKGHGGGTAKRAKHSSVESRTVSVQRLTGSLLDDSNTSSENDHIRDSPLSSSREHSLRGSPEFRSSITEEPLSSVERNEPPRSLRVSLSIGGEGEPSTPLSSKFNGSTPPGVLQKKATLPTRTLPSWDDIATISVGQKSEVLSPRQVSTISPVTTSKILVNKTTDGKANISVVVTPKDRLGKISLKQSGTLSDNSQATVTTPLTTSPNCDDVFEPEKSAGSQLSSSESSKPVSRSVISSVPSRPKDLPFSTCTSTNVVAMQASPLPTAPTSKPTEKHKTPSSLTPILPTPSTASNSPISDLKVARSSSISDSKVARSSSISDSKVTTTTTADGNQTNQPHVGYGAGLSKQHGAGLSKQHGPQGGLGCTQDPQVSKVEVSSGTISVITSTLVSQTPVSQGQPTTELVSIPVCTASDSMQPPKVREPLAAVVSTEADVIITGVEKKEQQAKPPNLTHTLSTQRPQLLRTNNSRPKKVIAKTVGMGSPSVLPPASLKPKMSPSTNITLHSLTASSSTPPCRSGETEQAVYVIPAGTENGWPPQTQGVVTDTVHSRPPPPYRSPTSRPLPVVASGVAPTTLVYTQAAPVAHSISEQSPEILTVNPNETTQQAGIVYYAVTSQAGTLSTTKPYAVVTALPNAIDSRDGVQVQVHGTNGSLQRGQVGVLAYTNPPPKKQHTSSPLSKDGSELVITDHDLAKTLQSINQNISAAFISCSEDMLMAAFEDAWKKFQANSRKYEALTRLEKSATKPTSSPTICKRQVPPNAEVVPTPGISKLSLVRPSNSRPKPIVPKPSLPAAAAGGGAAFLPTGSPSLPSPSQHVSYTYSPGVKQQQVIVQPINTNDAPYTILAMTPKHNKSYQTGLYFPAPPSSDSVVVQKPSMATSPGHQVITQSLLQQRPSIQTPKSAANKVNGQPTTPSGVTQMLASPTLAQHFPPRQKQTAVIRRRGVGKTPRSCSLCGADATYLCSGCHSEWYCGRDCQLKAWDNHSENCKA